MPCEHRLNNEPVGLQCTRTDPHQAGHVYVSTSGVPDRHELGDDE